MHLHFLDLETRNIHATNNIGEEGDHVVVAHGHVGHNPLQGHLLGAMILILLAAAVQLESKFGNFALRSS